MNPVIEKLRTELNDQLYAIGEMPGGLEKLNRLLNVIDKATFELNRLIAGLQFESQQEEVHFFKYQKPEILARRIEELMRYNLTVNAPIGTPESKIRYFEDELKARRSFFRMNSFHYQYFKRGISELDQFYFLRTGGPLSIPVADFPELENHVATPMSYLFAKFMAYENIQLFILEQIAFIRFPESMQQKQGGAQQAELKWTGDAVNIVELAYGIWLTGQLNNGNASLNQIVRWLENSLQVTIGIIQRRFSEIERRKRLSPTRYIDQMKMAILQKIESGNL
ncbi:RteC domain-containing protein [Mucilaginibacter sp. HD30]